MTLVFDDLHNNHELPEQKALVVSTIPAVEHAPITRRKWADKNERIRGERKEVSSKPTAQRTAQQASHLAALREKLAGRPHLAGYGPTLGLSICRSPLGYISTCRTFLNKCIFLMNRLQLDDICRSVIDKL